MRQEFPAVHERHPQVDEDEAGQLRRLEDAQVLERLHAVARLIDGKPLVVQDVDQGLPNIRIVLDDHQALRIHLTQVAFRTNPTFLDRKGPRIQAQAPLR